MTVIQLLEKARLEAEASRALQDKAEEEGRDMTSEEALAFDTHLTEARKYEKLAERKKALEDQERRLSKPQERQVPGETADGSKIEVATPKMFRFGQLRAFKGPKADADAYLSGRWLLAALMDHAPSRQWCNDNSVEIRRDNETRVQTGGVNAAGGFVVPDVMERAIIDLREQYGMFRREARVIPMSSDHTNIPRRAGGVEAYFIGETTEITASDKSWSNVELTAKKLGALTRMSTDLAEDAIINLADDLAKEMAYAFAKKEDQVGIDGNGTAAHGGMLGMRAKMIDGTHAGSYFEASAPGDNWSEITVTDLTGVMELCPAYALPSAKWYCSARAKTGVFDRLALALGGNTALTIAAGAKPQYSGYPIVTGAAMPTSDAGAALNAVIMLFFGDLSLSSTLGDRRGITVKVSTERYLEYDQIGIQATERFCIANHDIAGAAGTYGPLVGLLGNT